MRPIEVTKDMHVERLEKELAKLKREGYAPEGCIPVSRALLQRMANVDAFNAPRGAAMEFKTLAQQALNAAPTPNKDNT